MAVIDSKLPISLSQALCPSAFSAVNKNSKIFKYFQSFHIIFQKFSIVFNRFYLAQTAQPSQPNPLNFIFNPKTSITPKFTPKFPVFSPILDNFSC